MKSPSSKCYGESWQFSIRHRRRPNRRNDKSVFTSSRKRNLKPSGRKSSELFPAHRHDGSRPDQSLQPGRRDGFHSAEWIVFEGRGAGAWREEEIIQMSAFPNWQQHVVKQKRNQTGCIPTGYEVVLRASGYKGVNFETFQDEFDLDKNLKPGEQPQNNFETVAEAIQLKSVAAGTAGFWGRPAFVHSSVSGFQWSSDPSFSFGVASTA